jgi:GNAT superfamily N-acetyltransferase
MPQAAQNYSVDVKLLDGASIRIRAIRPDDKDRLHEHFKSLSERSVYFRFMGFRRDLSAADLAQLTELDFNDRVGLAATLTEDGRERFIGVGRYIRGASPSRAEVAFAVLDKWQGHGIATSLLEHLRRIANANGIAEFEADVLSDNSQMLEVFAHSGFRVRGRMESGVIRLYAPTASPEESR